MQTSALNRNTGEPRLAFVNEWSSPPEPLPREETEAERMVLWSQLVVLVQLPSEE